MQACGGCGSTTFATGSSAILDEAGRYLGAVCHDCTAQAAESPTLRKQIEIAARTGFPLSEVRRVFGSIGLAATTTAEEAVAALAAMMAMPGRA